jgi:hypothetical protein
VREQGIQHSFTSLLDQPVKDTLCGTKLLAKEDYAKIAANRSNFGEFDPFGDFDLHFGAGKLSLTISDIPFATRIALTGRQTFTVGSTD